jgi:hypothetical protein
VMRPRRRRTTGSSSYSRTAWFIRLLAAGFRLAERASPPTGAQDDRTTDSGAIGFPCAKTTAGPGARCGAWLRHRGEVRDAPVLLSRRTGWCLVLRIARCRIQRLESDPRAFPTLKARRGPQNCRPPTSRPRSRGELCIDRCPSKGAFSGIPAWTPGGAWSSAVGNRLLLIARSGTPRKRRRRRRQA